MMQDYQPPPAVIPEGWIAIPRRVVFCQAALIVAVALGGFVCGAMFGRVPSRQQSPGRGIVFGRVALPSRGPAANCQVFVLPVDARPQRPWDALSVRDAPGAIPLAAQDQITSIGGAWSQTSTTGEYRVVVPQPGEYFVFFLSTSPPKSPATTRQLAAIGQYFIPAYELVDRRDFAWLRQTVDGRIELNHQF